jgi:serine/threonine-protein kinase
VEEGFLASDFNEPAVSLSPDGKWMAYTSNASGRDEVFVRPFPSKSGRIPISNAGGTNPVWANNGSELFFIDGEGWLSVATFGADEEFVVESRSRLFDANPFREWSEDWRRFDVDSDDERFLMVRQVGGNDGLERDFIVIRNFFQEVLERVGG